MGGEDTVQRAVGAVPVGAVSAERPRLLNRLGLPDDPAMLGFDPGPVHRRADQLSADDRRHVLDRLGGVREGLGY